MGDTSGRGGAERREGVAQPGGLGTSGGHRFGATPAAEVAGCGADSRDPKYTAQFRRRTSLRYRRLMPCLGRLAARPSGGPAPASQPGATQETALECSFKA